MFEYLGLLTDAILLVICVLLWGRLRNQRDEIDELRATGRWLEDRIGTAIDLCTEQKEAQDRTEKLFFDGLSSIMNYDLTQARKAAGYGEDEE